MDCLRSCFFQPDPLCNEDFGPDYPDRTGSCWAAIEEAQKTIRKPIFRKKYSDAIKDILSHTAVSDKKDFRLFVLGYAQFFKINDPHNGDACDNISWTAKAVCKLPGGSRHGRYKVTTRLRQDVNDVIWYLNNAIETIVAEIAKADARVQYVDIDGAFEGHRFCQIPEGGSIKNGWEDSWFWHAPELKDFADTNDEDGTTSTPPEIDGNTLLDPAALRSCSTIKSGSALFTPYDEQLSCQLQAAGQPVAAVPIGPNVDYSGPGGGGLFKRGEVLRTFHPTQDGHGKIRDWIKEAIIREQKKTSFLKAT